MHLLFHIAGCILLRRETNHFKKVELKLKFVWKMLFSAPKI
jgi:hypothetical protein